MQMYYHFSYNAKLSPFRSFENWSFNTFLRGLPMESFNFVEELLNNC